MAYTVIPAGDIVAGKPTKEEIFDQIRTNQEHFNSEIEALNQTAIEDVMNFRFTGSIDQYSKNEVATRIPTYRAPVGLTIVEFKMILLEVSTSGTLGVELERSTDNGVNWTPLLDTPVELTGTTKGSISGTVDWSDPVTSPVIDQGDLIRIIIDSVQVDQGSFQLHIYGELS